MAETLEQANKRIAELEAQINSFHAELQAIKKEHEEPIVDPNAVKTVTVISEAKLRCWYVDPSHVKKIIRGTTEQVLPHARSIVLNPGCIVEVDEEFSKYLLSYKTFKVYGV